jgi:hypothetical protein
MEMEQRRSPRRPPCSSREMLLDLMHGKLDEILVDFGAHRGAQIMGIGLA